MLENRKQRCFLQVYIFSSFSTLLMFGSEIKNTGDSIFYTYLSSTDATLPSPSKNAPLERRLAMKLRSSGSTSAGRLVSTKERLDKWKTHVLTSSTCTPINHEVLGQLAGSLPASLPFSLSPYCREVNRLFCYMFLP